MSYHVYDADALRILSAVHNAAMRTVDSLSARTLGKDETDGLSKRITDKLMTVFDLGERDPVALHRAALEEIAP